MGARTLAVVVAAVAIAWSLTSCASPQEPGTTPATVAQGLDVPWSVAFYNGVALVSERDNGRILEIRDDGAVLEVAVLDGVTAAGEGGLLGITVHDDHLYTYFTASDENRIERHPLTGGPGSIRIGDPETVLAGIPSAGIHNGGRLAFGPDGMLYATAGDAGNRSNAQNPDSLAGKILRMAADGDIPEDNPDPDSYVYSFGHRNPQGIAWDVDGAMYAAEFGQDEWDELNIIEAGGNYGWPEVEGIAADDRYIDPVQQWRPDDASPSGMAIAGESIYIANLRGERLREVLIGDITASTEHWVAEYGRLRDVVVAPDGLLWVLTNNTDGRGTPGADDDRILRFDPGR